MHRRWFLALALALLPVTARAADTPRGLDIYFIDTEGGAATLIVTPTGESVLIDCGNPGGRDAERIHKACTAAGLKTIDHLCITHWHSDHYGGVARLSQLIDIKNYYDHCVPEKLDDDPKGFQLLIGAYKTANGGKSTTLKPGDELKLKQPEKGPALKLLCVSSGGEVIADKPGAPENPVAKEHKPMPEDKSDNARSLGFLLSYGDWRFVDLGDLTWNIEYKLIAPSDKLGLVDVFLSSHHGLNISNNPVLLQTIKPRVTVFNNGAKKGGHPSIIATLRRIPDTQAIYQVHRNLTAGAQENTDPEFIANPDEKCQGEGIKLSVAPDAKSYSLTVGSTGKPKTYETRKR
jgi:beta-lactamase superfamily II metal-dependent hydrolase